jgi:hypothetical protein
MCDRRGSGGVSGGDECAERARWEKVCMCVRGRGSVRK